MSDKFEIPLPEQIVAATLRANRERAEAAEARLARALEVLDRYGVSVTDTDTGKESAWFTELKAALAPDAPGGDAPDLGARLVRAERIIRDGIEAMRLTREYVDQTGELLPALPGWSWFDWSVTAVEFLGIGSQPGGDDTTTRRCVHCGADLAVDAIHCDDGWRCPKCAMLLSPLTRVCDA